MNLFNAVSVKAKREDIDQMVSDMMHDRKMKKKHVDSSSSGNTTSSLEPVQKKARIQMLDFHKPDQALNLCKGKESQPMPGIHTTDSLEFMASIETGRSSCNGYSVPADQVHFVCIYLYLRCDCPTNLFVLQYMCRV